MTASKTFDGVLVFGGVDWWYHNRGHYDLRMARLLAEGVPVLYVNSLGMRVPRAGEGGMFLRRILRKVRSMARGLVEVEPGFHVLSPTYVPGGRLEPALRGRLLRQVRAAMSALGLERPLVWVACPTAARVAFELPSAGVVFQRTDRFEAFDSGAAGPVERDCNSLLERSDLTLYCARALMAEETKTCVGRQAFVDHGVEFDAFSAAGQGSPSHPVSWSQLAADTRPKVGFVGGLDAHTFDLALFQEVARSSPGHLFVLVGSSSFPPDAFALSNVVRLPRVEPEEVPAHLAACDALIMPWVQSPWIDGCNPVKLKEYLAVGRPIVSTPFRELEHYAGLVRVASTAAQFRDQLLAATTEAHDPEPGRRRVAGHTWRARVAQVLVELAELGLTPASEQDRRTPWVA